MGSWPTSKNPARPWTHHFGRTFGPPFPALSNMVFYGDGTDKTTMTFDTSSGVTRAATWKDKLGSSNTLGAGYYGAGATGQYASTYFAGKGGIYYDGNNNTNKGTGAWGINYANGYTILLVVQSDTAQNYYMSGDGNGNVLLANALQNRAGNGTGFACPEGVPRGAPIIYGCVASAAGRYTPVLDGNILGYSTGWYTSGTVAGFYLGGSFPGGAANMHVQAVCVWNKPLSQAEINQAVAYLRSNFAVPAFPAASFNIVSEGDSISYGTGGNAHFTINDAIEAARGAPKPQDWLLFAQAGSQIGDLTNRASLVDARLNTTMAANRRILLVWAGTNDFYNDNTLTGSACYSRLKTYCQARKAAGWKVIVATCLPRSNGGTNFETARAQYNSLITTNATTDGTADAVADVASNATMGAAATTSNTTYYSDGVHPADAGCQLLSPYFTTALNSLLP